MRSLRLLLLTAALACPLVATAQGPVESAAIIAMMNTSADDWNRGDMDAFATAYKNSPASCL